MTTENIDSNFIFPLETTAVGSRAERVDGVAGDDAAGSSRRRAVLFIEAHDAALRRTTPHHAAGPVPSHMDACADDVRSRMRVHEFLSRSPTIVTLRHPVPSRWTKITKDTRRDDDSMSKALSQPGRGWVARTGKRLEDIFLLDLREIILLLLEE
ncbi:hypothetical protein EVAR_19696_1 [Eumeta japonica]|uniref:Uncharacterized protein n=1 Tax=Eumeta variegata TaxID=151549 RepID=A0A4C1V492_EUMVA|nr:hypothetical protein EVAR_19696_1 [Eumeta japonica]